MFSPFKSRLVTLTYMPLDAAALPALPSENRRITQQVLNLTRWLTSAEPRILSVAAPTLLAASTQRRTVAKHARPLHPAVEIRGHLGHEHLPTLFESRNAESRPYKSS